VTVLRDGAITVQSYSAEQPPGTVVDGGGASASFAHDPTRCSRETQGECTVLSCPTGAGALASAGTLAVDGAAQPVSLAPNDDNSYTRVMSDTPLYVGGETLAFSASGGDVPAFSDTVTAPGKAQITSPAKPAQYLDVDTMTGLRITWTGGGTGSLQLALFAGTTTTLSVSCRFPIAAGSGMVPAVTLGSLPVGQGGYTMAAVAETEVDAGDWAITLDAYYNAVWPDRSIVSGPTMVH
jgi:hypothetical protein